MSFSYTSTPRPDLVAILLYPKSHHLSACLESFPCEHYVREVYSDGTIKEAVKWTGHAICVYLNERGLHVPAHFVDSREFDTEWIIDDEHSLSPLPVEDLL